MSWETSVPQPICTSGKQRRGSTSGQLYEGRDGRRKIASYLMGAGAIDAGKHATPCGKQDTFESRASLCDALCDCSTGKSLPIFRNRVNPGNQKYSAFVLTQISRITPLVSQRMRGVGHRHERAVRCDGRGWRDRRTRLTRTAKSCGSGAAVLALSSGEAKASRGRRRQKSRSPGRARSKP